MSQALAKRLEQALDLIKKADKFQFSDLTSEQQHEADMNDAWGSRQGRAYFVEREQEALRLEGRNIIRTVIKELKGKA